MTSIRDKAIAAVVAGMFIAGAPLGVLAQESKVKDASVEVADKAEDVKDETVKGSKKAAQVTKEAGVEVADKAEDVKDETVKGSKKAIKVSKKVADETADKAEDVKDETVKGAKKTGNWFERMWSKVF